MGCRETIFIDESSIDCPFFSYFLIQSFLFFLFSQSWVSYFAGFFLETLALDTLRALGATVWKIKCSHPEITGQSDRQCLTGQAPQSGWTLSVDRPFLSVLISVNPAHQGITGHLDSQQPTGSEIIRICMGIYQEIDKTVKTHINSHLCAYTFLIKSCVCVVFLLFATL